MLTIVADSSTKLSVNAIPILTCPVIQIKARKATKMGVEIQNRVAAVRKYFSSFAPCRADEMRDTKMAPIFPATPETTGAMRPNPRN